MSGRRPHPVKFWFKVYDAAIERGMQPADARVWAGAASRQERQVRS